MSEAIFRSRMERAGMATRAAGGCPTRSSDGCVQTEFEYSHTITLYEVLAPISIEEFPAVTRERVGAGRLHSYRYRGPEGEDLGEDGSETFYDTLLETDCRAHRIAGEVLACVPEPYLVVYDVDLVVYGDPDCTTRVIPRGDLCPADVEPKYVVRYGPDTCPYEVAEIRETTDHEGAVFQQTSDGTCVEKTDTPYETYYGLGSLVEATEFGRILLHD
jgi:hypothetical protein